jgi:hypothetical protein
MAIRAGHEIPIAGDCHHTVSAPLPPTTAGQSAVFRVRSGPGPAAGPVRLGITTATTTAHWPVSRITL